MRYKTVILLFMFCFVFVFAGCFEPSLTKTGDIEQVVEDVEEEQEINIPDTGLGILPAQYTIDGFHTDFTVDLEFRIYNEMDYSSRANMVVMLPNETQKRKHQGYVSWGNATAFCTIVEDDLMVGANGNKDVTVRVYIPKDEEMPDNWFFYVGYHLEGHMWGNYVTTLNGNFVFIPSNFDIGITDSTQTFSWLTWGNSPELMVRAQYGSPPESIEEGELVYQGSGEQVIKDWYYPKKDKIIDRQYTQFTIEENRVLSWQGGEKLFYRAWMKYLENGVWKGKWNPVGQNLYIPQVAAKVLVHKE